uniref:Uncharacterized protein n=1 Tax=Heterorhabditis bacteriophora TaxID=37862 RepID=A0A1I7WX28_HETBA
MACEILIQSAYNCNFIRIAFRLFLFFS